MTMGKWLVISHKCTGKNAERERGNNNKNTCSGDLLILCAFGGHVLSPEASCPRQEL